MPSHQELINLLDGIRARFNKARHSGVNFKDKYHSCKKEGGFISNLFGSDTRFDKLYQDQQKFYRHGQIVWGAVIQANQSLFTPGEHDCPAAFLYSLDSSIDGQVDTLLEAAKTLYSIKGIETDRDLQIFSDKLADGKVADWKLPVPPRLTKRTQCFYTTTMVFRKHLPNECLNGSFFPLIVAPRISDVAFILPEKYWGSEFINNFWPE